MFSAISMECVAKGQSVMPVCNEVGFAARLVDVASGTHLLQCLPHCRMNQVCSELMFAAQSEVAGSPISRKASDSPIIAIGKASLSVSNTSEFAFS